MIGEIKITHIYSASDGTTYLAVMVCGKVLVAIPGDSLIFESPAYGEFLRLTDEEWEEIRFAVYQYLASAGVQ